jgi:ribosomal-protein-alanine N-acetyltransferase
VLSMDRPESTPVSDGHSRAETTAGFPREPIAPERIETERMIGERLRLEHGPDLERLLMDPRVTPTMWARDEPITPTDVRAGLRGKLRHWESYGFGQWLMRDRQTGEMVGRGGPQWTSASGDNEVEIGWVIVPERWGEGLATELARASLAVAFGPLGLTEVIAYTLPDNTGSRRVMEKTGFVYDREIVYEGLRHVLYRRCAPERAS